MTSWSLLEVQVELRAGGRCEYCQMHQSLQGATFHVEHIVPRCRGGSADFDNLAWACPSCNLHKSDRVSAVTPGTDQEVSLFHPRVDRWHDHFCWEGYRVVGRTLSGQATIAALVLNHERRLRIRQAEALFGQFPARDRDA